MCACHVPNSENLFFFFFWLLNKSITIRKGEFWRAQRTGPCRTKSERLGKEARTEERRFEGDDGENGRVLDEIWKGGKKKSG